MGVPFYGSPGMNVWSMAWQIFSITTFDLVRMNRHDFRTDKKMPTYTRQLLVVFRCEGPSMNGTGDTLQQPLLKWTKSFMRSLTVLPKDVLREFCFRVLKGESRVFQRCLEMFCGV